jgi:hypothetical protein
MPEELTISEFKEKIRDRLHTILPKDTPENFIDNAVDIYMNLPYVDPDMDIRDDNLLFVTVFPFLAEIQYTKEGGYGRSWCKRGEMDVFFNTARKFDRIENIMLNNGKDEVGEATIDTVGDMANYGMLWMTYYLRVNTEAFITWAKNN